MRTAKLRAVRALRPAAIALAAAGFSWCAQASAETRTLSFYNIHTKENVTITYKRDGKFLPDGLKQISHIMRDWRRDEATEMDPELIDTIWKIYQDVGSQEPIHLVSGYRSRGTNERLRRRGGGQARKSQHILGKAADIHFPDVPVKRLRNSALVREAGGVGYYPKSGLPFVHVDTGRIRHWPRIPRQELALLFPDGKTEHVPSDGRPLTRHDGAMALAKLEKKIDNFIDTRSKIDLPPKMMMAGFTPPALKWTTGSAETTAALPRETPPAPPTGAAEERPGVTRAPQTVTLSTLEDAEHPDELSYTLYSVLPLMEDEPISVSRRLAALTAPGADEDQYLLRDAEGVNATALARGLGYTHELKLVTFGTQDLAAANTPPAGDRPFRTASR